MPPLIFYHIDFEKRCLLYNGHYYEKACVLKKPLSREIITSLQRKLLQQLHKDVLNRHVMYVP